MKKFLFSIFIIVLGANLFAQNNKWNIVEIKDQFGDKTGEKRLAYATTGTFSNFATRNSKLDVFLLVDNPYEISSIIVYEYGKYEVELNDGVFTYKIDDTLIENIPIKGENEFRCLNIILNNEGTSLIYLLKQGGLIKFSVRKDETIYRFDVDAGNFSKLLSEIFTNKDSYMEFCYDVDGENPKPIQVNFVLKYNWNYEREVLLRNNEDIRRIVFNFFKDKDRDFAYDKLGEYYQRDKVLQNWGAPLLELIKQEFHDINLEYDSFRAW